MPDSRLPQGRELGRELAHLHGPEPDRREQLRLRPAAMERRGGHPRQRRPGLGTGHGAHRHRPRRQWLQVGKSLVDGEDGEEDDENDPPGCGFAADHVDDDKDHRADEPRDHDVHYRTSHGARAYPPLDAWPGSTGEYRLTAES